MTRALNTTLLAAVLYAAFQIIVIAWAIPALYAEVL